MDLPNIGALAGTVGVASGALWMKKQILSISKLDVHNVYSIFRKIHDFQMKVYKIC